MKTENDCRCDKRINQLEEALRNIANGDMRTSRAKAKMALEGTFPPVDEKPEQEAQSHGNDQHAPPFGTLFDGGKLDEQTTPAATPWSDKSAAYWHDQYQLMREKFWKELRVNSELAEQRKVRGFLLNEAMKDLETEQAAKRELYAMLRHIVDWSPELPYYMKDEYKTLFRNALAAARELLSKCKVKEGK